MAQKLTLKAKGLYTYPNQLSEVPEGGLITADNIVIDREGTIEPRRGYYTAVGSLGVLSENRAVQVFSYDNYLISHYGPDGVGDTLAFYAPEVVISGVQTASSNVITNVVDTEGLYVGQTISTELVQFTLIGDQTSASDMVTNIVSSEGLYTGQSVGGLGIPSGATIIAISGTGPYSIQLSAPVTVTQVGSVLTVSNSSVLGFAAGTKITTIGPTSVTVSNNSTVSSRTFSFSPSDVDPILDTIVNSGLIDDEAVQFSSSGTLPAPLVSGTVYYVIDATPSLFSVSATPGGDAVNLTTTGSGVHTLTARANFEAAGWIDYSGDYAQPSEMFKIRSVEANSNVYFTTDEGIKKLDAIGVTPTMAGAPRGLDISTTLAPGASGFMIADTQVAYRVLWGYKDLNGNLILGVPSQRSVVVNSGESSRDVTVNITIPSEVTTAYFYQVYRSGFSADSDTEPNDEMALVYEANPTSGEITAKTLSFTDQTPESLRNGAALYTNSTQEGIAQSNYAPPSAKDVALFKGSVFYGNTSTKENLTLNILAVSGQFSISGDTTSTGADTPTTVRNLASTVTGDTTNGSNTITAVSSVSNMSIGQLITGSGIPADSFITEIVSTTSIKISNAATATASTVTLTLAITGTLIGQLISGTNIPASTTVTETYEAASITGDTSTGTPNIINISDTSTIKVGQPISGTDIPSGTVVLTIVSGTAITISKNATGTTPGLAITLGNGVKISNAATGTGTVTLTFKNGSTGITLDDTITIAGTTLTAKLVENVASKHFKIFSQGSPSQNIADTARSLVKVINQTTTPTPTIYAYYTSGFSALPGQIQFQERSVGGGEFYAVASAHGSAYSPNLPTSGTTVASTNDEFKNGLYFSKTQQPEAVPLLNFTRVGTANAAILRVIPLRDSLFIIKEDGIFRLSGEDPASFRVDLFDSTTNLIAPESAVSLNNVIFMLAEAGVVTVSDTGVTAISRAIDDLFLDIFEQSLENVKRLSFAISYETDRKYILFTISTDGDTSATQALVYNVFTETWTRWILTKTCGITHPSDDVIWLGNGNSPDFNVERKDRRYTDYVDDAFDVTIQSYDGNEIVLNTISDIEVGDVLWQMDGRFSMITAVDTSNATVTVRDTLSSWALGPAAILVAIPSVFQYVAMTAKNPGALKQFRECVLLFQVPFFNFINLGFTTDLSDGQEDITLTGQYGALWGLFPWGSVPWGGASKPTSLRTYVPQQKQRCSLLNTEISHREAYSFYRLNGVSYIHNDPTERVNR